MRYLRILIIGALLALSALSACDFNSPGPFDRKQMESLVSQVRSQHFEGEKIFRWQEVAGAATLVTDERQRQVWAVRNANQQLTVVILVWGGTHYGAAGFAYSDSPFVRSSLQEEAPPGGCTLDLPGPLRAAYPQKQIDGHWWPVFDNVN
jgi:hypothetical protein